MRSKSEIQNEIDEMQSKIERLNSILSAMDRHERSNWNYGELSYQRRGCERKVFVLRLEKAETQEEKNEIMQELKNYCSKWINGLTMALAKVANEKNYAGQIDHETFNLLKEQISWLDDESQSIANGAYIPTEEYIKRADLPINDAPPPRSSSSSSSRRTGGMGCGCLTITLTIVAVFVICISMLL